MPDYPPPAWKPCTWPADDAPGRYTLLCSCGKWSFTGTAAECHAASRSHDDSPWQNHVVVSGRMDEGGSDA